MNKKNNEYRVVGVDKFAPDGERYVITEADCLIDEDNEWADFDPKYEWGEDDWDDDESE